VSPALLCLLILPFHPFFTSGVAQTVKDWTDYISLLIIFILFCSAITNNVGFVILIRKRYERLQLEGCTTS
jgi:hypothetical protein